MERGVRNQQQQRGGGGGGDGGGGGGGCRGGGVQSEPDFFLQWGNRKRLRCVKVLVKDDGTEKTTVRVDRRVVRADKDSLLLLRRPSPHSLLIRNSENSSASAMKGQSNGTVRGASPEGAEPRVSNGNAGGSGSSETAHDKKGAGSSSGSDATVWPKFTIALSNKEKEEDFWAIKGSKLPQRPKKRSKFIQRTLNLVSPGTWLSDLTLERYEVREKKISKKRPRGLKAMGNMESDSE